MGKTLQNSFGRDFNSKWRFLGFELCRTLLLIAREVAEHNTHDGLWHKLEFVSFGLPFTWNLLLRSVIPDGFHEYFKISFAYKFFSKNIKSFHLFDIHLNFWFTRFDKSSFDENCQNQLFRATFQLLTFKKMFVTVAIFVIENKL